MKKFKKLILVLIIIAILLTVQVIIIKNASQYEAKINIVYAKTDIPAKTVITSDMLTTKSINLSMVHLQAYRSTADLIGKTAKADIADGEMILNSRIGKPDEMAEIKVLDKNNRLFAIEFKPDQANGWWLLLDQKVDLIFVPTSPAGVNAPTSLSRPSDAQSNTAGNADQTQFTSSSNGIKRLSNIRVAAIIDETLQPLANDTRTSIPKYIVFEVAPQQDEFLAWAKSNGRIELSVRTEK